VNTIGVGVIGGRYLDFFGHYQLFQ